MPDSAPRSGSRQHPLRAWVDGYARRLRRIAENLRQLVLSWTDRGPELLLPGLAGAGILAGLAALGLSLGSLYAGFTRPAAVPLATSAVVTSAPGIVAEEAVGGPEESGAAALLPAAGALAVAAAARTGLVERAVATGSHDPARPVFWPVVGGWVSSPYGKRNDPFTGEPSVHRGMDFAGLQNSAILAAGAGVVTWSGERAGYGNLIEIDHGNGYVSRYGHNASNLVAVGDYVKAGQIIALMGATGRARGNHLHFEILLEGRHVNPARLVQRGS